MTRISPSNHADALLVHDPAISLADLCQFNEVQPADWRAYDNAYADDSVEKRKVPSDIVLRRVKKCEGQCANQHSNVEIRNPS